jgi:Mn-dependent DtxR family transcriptional regulator
MSPEPSGDGSDGIDYLFWRDEVLEAAYWMMNEGIERAVGPADLAGFLNASEETLQTTFDRMAGQDLIEPDGDGYGFTERGESEAKRRFAEEFGHLQGFGESHADCGPDCWCHDADHAEEECPSHDDHQHA